MNDLLDLTIKSNGGIDNWRKFKNVTVRIQSEGATWIRKQQTGLFSDIYVSADLTKQHVSFYPVNGENWHSSFVPGRIAIENKDGSVVDELLNPVNLLQVIPKTVHGQNCRPFILQVMQCGHI